MQTGMAGHEAGAAAHGCMLREDAGRAALDLPQVGVGEAEGVGGRAVGGWEVGAMVAGAGREGLEGLEGGQEGMEEGEEAGKGAGEAAGWAGMGREGWAAVAGWVGVGGLEAGEEAKAGGEEEAGMPRTAWCSWGSGCRHHRCRRSWGWWRRLSRRSPAVR